MRTGATGTGDGDSEADIVHIDRPVVPAFTIIRGLAPAAHIMEFYTDALRFREFGCNGATLLLAFRLLDRMHAPHAAAPGRRKEAAPGAPGLDLPANVDGGSTSSSLAMALTP